MSQSFDILGFGAVAVDDLLYVDEYPLAESKVRLRHRMRQCGGLTGTALVTAARLGVRCAYVGILGNDELSLYVVDSFARECIDTKNSVRRDTARPAHSTIIVDERNRTRTIFASLAGDIGADENRPSPEIIRSAKVLLIDHHGVEGTIRAVKIARESGVAVVADFERNPGGKFSELLPLVDHLVISKSFASKLSGQNDPASSAVALMMPDRKAVVVTCGEQGSWYIGPYNKSPLHCSAFSVDVIDTTGCGDVFHGAYAAALVMEKTLAECVEFASATAAIKATQRGGQAGCPTRQAVEEFLRQ